ncbi:MAG: hypothetical protein FIA99_00625 [Ruminiclostridium sp.]|nr:hypothetical protein [Ruminiclostridium sp.]
MGTNGLQKLIEYEEEKIGGLLLVYFIMLITLEIFIGIIVAFQMNMVFFSIPIAGTIILTLNIIYIASILFTAISIYKIEKYAIKISKVFLIVRLIFLNICFIIVFVNFLNGYEGMSISAEEAPTLLSLIINYLMGQVIYTLAFSILWYLYFNKSKKIRDNYMSAIKAYKS